MKYNELKKSTNELLKNTRRMARSNTTYKNVKRALDEMRHDAAGDAEEDGDDMYQEGKIREKLRKRRKILKPFREYTFWQGEEGRSKGWSKTAANDMAALCKNLKEEKEEHGKFRAAYREIYHLRHQAKPKAIEVEEVQVDYRELWDVENINNNEEI